MQYEVRNAIANCEIGLDREMAECYEDSFSFEAANDDEAIKIVEEMQDKHDAAARAVVEQDSKFQAQYDCAPSYIANLWRIGEGDDDDERVE